ncbi:ZIP family metal transporter [Halorussus sp. MSC15.2]|uniref:ZIP family metal transporter n=1 Tax=Halorussus sp. MSC15.2 TaxID=2283638 RepID=UPI0013D0C705|nr:ZIP family metal transporter [Halorussus sp. MSC15.2]NEU56057.1 ZIP family metal transporter [Halorussus sp. MSC15.2]
MPVSRLGLVGPLALLVLTPLALRAGLTKVLAIAWIAFAAMGGAAFVGERTGATTDAGRLVWGYGLASGAMITSAAVFIVPGAIDHHPKFGGFGIAFGVLVGFSAHTLGHRAMHADLPFDHTAVELTAHSLAAGSIIGLVYGNMTDLGLLLGLAIVSHKGPAGYAAADRLRRADKPVSVLLLPAAGVGLTAIPAALLTLPSSAPVNAVVFGFAAGIFLHIAMDFLPRCELGGEVYEVAQITDDAHELLDRLRAQAVVSTGLGAVAVFVAWMILRPGP